MWEAGMAAQSGVFVLQGENSLISMQPTQFAAETDFQDLLSRFPELLVGDQINPQEPRRWILVKREQTITTSENGASQWSVDHLFLDQDGIPTLVEVKRQSDSRIRREVVGQMLDYAANCMTYWSVAMLQAGFEKTCALANRGSDEVLTDLLNGQSIGDFWDRVKTNLEAGRVRLLFVADSIPLELKRIVEFLNRQMNPAEVLAIELRQYTDGAGTRTIVPMVYGLTQDAVSRKAASAQGQTWDRESFLEALKKNEDVTPDQFNFALQILAWMERDGRHLLFGSGQGGSVAPDFRPQGIDFKPVYLKTDGRLYLQFGSWSGRPVFGSLESRRELVKRFGAVNNANFDETTFKRYPSLSLRRILRDPDGPSKILSALNWMEERITDVAR
jgi:hypothetical protein